MMKLQKYFKTSNFASIQFFSDGDQRLWIDFVVVLYDALLTTICEVKRQDFLLSIITYD